AQAGADTTVVGKHPGKLERAGGRGLKVVLAEDYRPTPLDLVVDATGSERGLAAANESVRPRPTLVLKSAVGARHHHPLAPLVIHDVTVIGSRCGPFAPALEALAAGRVSVEPLVDACFPLAEGLDAVERASAKPTLKVLLRP